MSEGSGLTRVVEEHPGFIMLLTLAVALLAYFQSRGSGGGATQTTLVGAPHQSDPGAVAISEAQIAAGQANLSTAAQLIGLESSNDAQVTMGGFSRDVSIFQAGAARDVSLASSAADVTKAGFARDVSLFQTQAEENVGLAGISASQDVANQQTAASVTNNAANNSTAVTVAGINATTAQQQIAANAAAAKAQTDAQNFSTQAAKDSVRAQVNGNILDTIVKTVGNIFTFGWL